MKTLTQLTLLSSTLLLTQAAIAAPTVEALWERIELQEKEIQTLKNQQSKTEEIVEATADAVESELSTTSNKSFEWATKTTIGGYGEHHYNNIEGKDDKVDAHRFVLFIGHEFSDNIRFFSEFELEHGLSGDGKPGEVELEQAYIEWGFAENHSLVAGQFLVPVGILNETHEPETFYGTERNLVEKSIIPTTWWETGGLIKGELSPGLSYDVAIHSGLNNDSGNIRSGRQKSAKAVANDLAYTARIKYTAVPGLELASTLQHQENLTQGSLTDAAATLFEAHAIYAVADFSLRALWASWSLDGEQAEIAGTDKQEGFYLEPSYKITDQVGVFARYSEWNNTAGLADSAATEVFDFGVNYWLLPNVVFKADVSKYQNDSGADSVNLGLGWSF